MQSASCSCSPEQRFCFSSDTQGCALRCVISGRSTGSCAMSPCYQAGPHNYSMSLPGWFSHHLELLSLTGGTEKDQWRGSDVTPLFEAHLCCWLGEALLSVLSAECPKHLHLRGSTKLEAFFFFFLSPSMKLIYFSFGSHCAPRAEGMHLMSGWSSAAEGPGGEPGVPASPCTAGGAHLLLLEQHMQPQVTMGANGCPRMWHSVPPLHNLATVRAFYAILGAPQ